MTVENEWFTIIALSAAQLTITYQLSPTILYNSHCSLIGRAYHAGIRLQALRYITVTSNRSHRTGRQFFLRQSHVNLPGRNIDFDNVSVYNFSDIASSCRFRRNMSDTQSGSSTAETSVGNQSTFFSEMTGFYIRGRIKHFLHTGTTLRTFVRDDDDVSTDDSTSEDAFTGCFLRIKYFGRSGKLPDTFVYTCCFYYTTILSNIHNRSDSTDTFAYHSTLFAIVSTPDYPPH